MSDRRPQVPVGAKNGYSLKGEERSAAIFNFTPGNLPLLKLPMPLLLCFGYCGILTEDRGIEYCFLHKSIVWQPKDIA